MMSNARCWRRRLVVLAIAAVSLSGCAVVGSEPSIATGCPPAVKYSREFQTRAAEELTLLPDGSVVAEMLSGLARKMWRAPTEFGNWIWSFLCSVWALVPTAP